MATNYRLGESSTRAVRKVRVDELELPERPEYAMPTIPADITAVDSATLMDIFVEINSWMDYVDVQLAAALIDEKYEEQKLEEITAREHLQAKDEKNVATMKAVAFENPDFLAQRERVHQAYGYRRITETIYNRLDRGKFVISREITRRAGDFRNSAS